MEPPGAPVTAQEKKMKAYTLDTPGIRIDVDALLGRAAQTAPDLLPCQRIAAKAPQEPKPGWMPKEA